MNISELDSYDLGDAVKFNDKLNPRIWGADEKMRPQVREQLLKIADDFREFLGIDVEVKDITVSGSNAAFTYTPHSDIDLHLVVDLPEADRNEVYRELFDAKKYAYNDMHDIKIGVSDVELYVQDANKKHHSQGIYSLINNDWVSVPKRRQPDVDDISVKSKFEDLGHRIETAIKSQDYEKISAMAEKIRDYRQAGLDAHGEFGPENLAFKILRTQGLIKKLYDARNAAKDELLSLDERKKKKKKKTRYGFGGYWYPGYAYAGQDHPAGTEGGDGGGDGGESVKEDAGMTWDGVNPTTDMFTSEDATMTWDGVNPTTAMFTTETQDPTDEEILRDFIEFCVKELKIKHMPRVKLRRDPQWPAVHKTFGRYNDENKTLEVAWGQRHIMDVLRTVAHELTHKHQHEREGDRMGPDAGETGSPYENEANARAGVLMRDYGRLHPEYFAVGQVHDLEEGIDQELSDNDKLYLRILDNIKYRSQDFLKARGAGGGRSFTPSILVFLKQLQQLGKENVVKFIQQSIAQANQEDRQTKGMSYGVLAQALVQLADQEKEKTFADARREYNKQKQSVQRNVEEGASGYIPTRAQAKDPRYSMALTVDIKPGQVGKEANKLKLRTNRQGAPQIARANGLFETLMTEYKGLDEANIPATTGKFVSPTGSTSSFKAGYDLGVKVVQTQTIAPVSRPDIARTESQKYPQPQEFVAGFKRGASDVMAYSRNQQQAQQDANKTSKLKIASLEPDVVKQITDRYASGELPGKIAPDFGLSAYQIREVIYQQPNRDEIVKLNRQRRLGQKNPQQSLDFGQENLLKEYKKFKADEDYSPDEPPGPESKPTMPAGTLRVGVSDVYDWYKLGQHISNMKGLGKHDFGQGPPASIISFGDEETEHKFIQDLKATGLDVTDIDPVDPKQPPGMRKIKTDPTYNVDEAIQAPVSKQDSATQDYYKFIMGKIKLGRVLNRQEQEFLKMYNLKQKVAEYAVTPDRGDDDAQGPDYIQQLANRWWNAADPKAQQRIADVIRTFGYEISQVESEDDAVQLTDRKSGHTYFISADEFDPDLYEVSDERLQQYLRRAGQQVDRRQERMAQARERLNKGYEIYDAEDPTRIVHRFEADTPAEAQRYYETFIDRYESDRDFDLQLRRSTGLMETAQGESEQQHGWRAELVDEISPITFEVRLTNRRSRESANFVVRPADLIRKGLAGKLEIDSMDIQDLQTGATRSIVSDDSAPWVYILDAVDALFYDTPALQARLQTQLKAYQDKDLPMLPGLKKREHFGQGIAVKDFVQGQQAAKDAVARAQGRQDIQEDEELDEVKMSPSALEKFATSKEAQGIRAGFEAELIFRDTQGSSDDIDPEPDYDADERAYSIQQVIEFFEQDEYGYGLSDRERNRLEEQLDETYMNWRDDQIISDFRNDAEDLIREKLLDETPLSERIHLYLTDSEQMSDKEADRIIAAGVDAPRFNTSKDQAAYAAENPYYQAYLDAADAAELELDESVEYSVSREDEYWDEALDDYRDNWSGDDDSFFSDVGLRWMSDIANEFGLDWPVWNMDSDRNNGSRSWEDIGSELQAVVDMPVVVSDNYHSTRRRPGQWIIEPDGSLHPDDQSEEAGLEIVSPPMPLLTAIEKLRQVTDWANDPQGGNAYTNGTTGLHMGVSLPRFTSEDADSDSGIDYVKLILFMGDKYVQQQFGREANNFCASALGKLQQNIKGKRSDPAGVIELLRHGLTELAYKELQKGVGTSKYTSAHIQDGYIEFRSPGGDWLAKSDEEIGILENTMLRFARAMAIAGDPSADRKEYAKKLYKLVTQDNEQYADQLRLFSEFSAGTINKEQLKKQWADSVLRKEIPTTGQEEYEVYDANKSRSPEGVIDTFYAQDYNDAYEQYTKKYVNDPRWTQTDIRLKQPWFDVQDATGKNILTMRAPDIDKATQRVQYEYGEKSQDWKVYRRPDESPEPEKKLSPRAQVAKRITTKPKTATQYNYDIVDQRTVELRVVDRFRAETPAEAEKIYSQWLKSKDLPDDTANYGYRKNAQAADNQRDSVDTQRRLGVQDVDTDVAQNFEPDLSAYERNSDRIDAIRAGSQQPRQNYEFVSDEDPDRVIHRMNDATADEVRAWIAQQEQGGMPPGFLRTRIVAESTGQHDDEQTQTALDMAAVDFNYRNWADVEMRGTEQAKTAIRRHAVTKLDLAQPKPFNMLGKSRSAISKGVDQVDREFINKQIQTARKLGDDVNENFADGKVKGKSRPGRVKRAGASCAGSVTSLRARAKNSSGEKAKMYHWCANMKAGRKK